jgi:acyl-CoA reductase-like NAD-dependent aldehyde dehydrogenase
VDLRDSGSARAGFDGPRQLLIDGAWRDAAGGKQFDVFNPATGQILGAVAEGGAEDIDLAVQAARRTFDAGVWWSQSPSARAKVLWKVADLIEARLEALARLEVLDNGMPYTAALYGVLPGAVETFRYFAGLCGKVAGAARELQAMGRPVHGYTVREPVGVAGLIVPWNFPFASAAMKVAPALAAGCSCVLKPSEVTPLSALLLGEMLLEAGLPEGVLNIVPGRGAVAGAALAAHPLVDKISFTGSTGVGKTLTQAVSGNLKRLTLELGGKSPVIVCDDADLEQAAQGAASAIFFNTGQVCIAGSRLYAHKSIFDRLVAGVADAARNIRVGDGMDMATQMGPLVSGAQLERVASYVESGRADGAEVVCGGGRIGEQGYFYSPTVLAHPKPESAVVREEIFGPVLVAMPFDDIDDVVRVANDTPYGLAASIWTRDISRAHTTARKLKAGNVWINTHMLTDPSMPFGGFKQSGWGRENGEEGLSAFLETKSVYALL